MTEREMTPEEIWLQVELEPEITWCKDRIEDTDVKYIRADRVSAAVEADRKARREDDECLTFLIETEVRAAIEAEREPLLDVIESCFSVGEIRFGRSSLASVVRGKVMDILIRAGRIDNDGVAIRRGDDDR